ncbi:MAG: hypothetical protein AB1898_24400 [Acidobacteriota bacterium]
MRSRRLKLVLAVGVAALVLLAVSNLGYNAGSTVSGQYCTTCHLIQPAYDRWADSSHRQVACKECHGSALTLDLDFHQTNFRRLISQLKGNTGDRILLRGAQAETMVEECLRCHRNEHARWKAGGHSATYTHIFLNAEHNRKRLLVEDCARCHGMFFEGTVAEVVAPLDQTGPWRLVNAEMASQAVIPCLTCHQVHRLGQPLGRPHYAQPRQIAQSRIIKTSSLGFYDRREKAHISSDLLPMPVMVRNGQPVRMSPDVRQRLCYQCHAPEATAEVGSGDDRTGMGVHEGIGCLGCHESHSLDARLSCANCHPRLSNCGLDVEKMDTTFKAHQSRHNIHFVACRDCHPRGIPPRKLARLDGNRIPR